MRTTLTQQEHDLVLDAMRTAQESHHEFLGVRVTDSRVEIVISGSGEDVLEFIRTMLPDENLWIMRCAVRERLGPVPRPYSYSPLYT